MKKRSVLRIFAAVCTVSMLFLCTACGKDTAQTDGGSAESKSSAKIQKYTGTYQAVTAESMHIQMNAAEVYEQPMSLKLKKNGTAALTVGEEKNNGTWEQKDSVLTFSFEEDGKTYTFTGTPDKDKICCNNLMNTGVNVTFGKKGTDAEDITNYLTKKEAAVVGHWMSETVDLRDGYGNQPEMEDVEDIHDALQVRFSPDYTCSVTYMGDEVGEFHWHTVGDIITLDSEKPGLLAEANGDGTISVSYCRDGTFEEYKTFTCVPYSGETDTKKHKKD